MDALLAHIVMEIALEGAEGASIPRLFHFVRCYYDNIPTLPYALQPLIPEIDSTLQEYIWSLIKVDGELNITVLDKDELLELVQRQVVAAPSAKKSQKNRRISTTEIDPLADIKRQLNKLSTIPKPTADALASCSIAVLYSKYGDRVRIQLDEIQRKNIVHNDDYPPSEQLYCVSEQIVRWRAVGITQASVAKICGLDPRSAFHFIKILRKKILIVKFPVVTNGQYTHLLIDIRYAQFNSAYTATVDIAKSVAPPVYLDDRDVQRQLAQTRKQIFFPDGIATSANITNITRNSSNKKENLLTSFHSEIVRRKITDILSSAFNNVMVTLDMVSMLDLDTHSNSRQRRWFTRNIAALAHEGYIERISIPREKKGRLGCIKLLKPYQLSSQLRTNPFGSETQSFAPNEMPMIPSCTIQSKEGSEQEQEHLTDRDHINEDGDNERDKQEVTRVESRDQTQPRKLLADLPVEYQVLQLVDQSGTEGIIGSVLRKALYGISIKPFSRILDRLVKSKKTPADAIAITRIPEFHGRERRYRYFSNNISQKGKSMTQELTMLTKFDGKMKDHKRVGQLNEQTELKLKTLVSSATPTPSSPKSPPMSFMRLLLTSPKADTKKEDVEPTPVSPLLIESPPPCSPTTNTNDPSGITTHKRFTIQALRRRTLLIEMLQEKRIIENNTVLLNDVRSRYTKLYANEGKVYLDPRTLRRTIDNLEVDQLLSVLIIATPSVSGAVTKRQLLLYRNPEGTNSVTREEIDNFKVQLQEKDINGPSIKLAKTKMESIVVQRLIKPRVTTPVENRSSVDSGNQNDDNSYINEVESNKEDQVIEQPLELHWKSVAQRYGYIDAKMIRVQLLHLFLYKSLKVENDLVRCTPDDLISLGTFSTIMIFRDISLKLYLQIVGHSAKSDELSAFVCSGDNDLTAKITNVSATIRQVLLEDYKRKARFRHHIVLLINILVALNLLTPVNRTYDDMGKLTSEEVMEDAWRTVKELDPLKPAYRINRSAMLFDFSQPMTDRTILKTTQLNHIDNANAYWRELAWLRSSVPLYQVINKEEVNLAENNSESNNDGKMRRQRIYNRNIASSQAGDPLRFIGLTRNWVTTYIYSKEQRAILNQACDRQLGITPLLDNAACLHLANVTNLEVARIKEYFKCIEDEHSRRIAEREVNQAKAVASSKAQHRKHVPVPSTERPKILDRLVHKRQQRQQKTKQKEKELASSPTLGPPSQVALSSKDQAQTSRRKRQESDEEAIAQKRLRQTRGKKSGFKSLSKTQEQPPEFESEASFLREYQQYVRRNRKDWLEDEDETLLISYTILSGRWKHGKIMWMTVRDLFPDTSPLHRLDAPRRRVHVMLKTEPGLLRFEELRQIWEGAYIDALCSGELPDQREVGNAKFDLQLHVDYFYQFLSRRSSHLIEPVHILPVSIEALHQSYRIKYPFQQQTTDKLGGQALLYEQVNEKMTTLTKLLLMHQNALYVESQDDRLYDIPDVNVYENAELRCCRHIIKMIVLTPEQKHNTGHTFCLLQRYADRVVSVALDAERIDGVVIRTSRGQTYRYFPGRGIQLSDKFMSTLEGTILPKTLLQASRFVNLLYDIRHQRGQHIWRFDPLINDGGMLGLIELLAEKRIKLQLHFPFLIFMQSNIIPYDSRKLDTIIQSDSSLSVEIEDVFSVKLPSNTMTTNAVTTVDQSVDNGGDITMTDTNSTNEDQSSLENNTLDDLIWTCAHQADTKGVSLFDIKDSVQAMMPYVKDQSIHESLGRLCVSPEQATKRLRQSLVRVGTLIHRYVVPKSMHPWLVDVQRQATNGNLSMSERNEASKMPFYVVPRIWIDTCGNLAEAVMRSALCSVASLIMIRSGIYECEIFRCMQPVLTPTETSELLDKLVERDAVYRRSFVVPPKISLFDKSPGMSIQFTGATTVIT